METFLVSREQLEKWQKTALEWKIDSIGVDIMHVLAKPADQHQGEPVALPERKGTHLRYDTLMPTFSKGWNACLDEIAKLGPLYTHPAPADPGEVEALRYDCKVANSVVNTKRKEIERLKLNISEMNEDARIREGQIAELRGELENVVRKNIEYRDAIMALRAEIKRLQDAAEMAALVGAPNFHAKNREIRILIAQRDSACARADKLEAQLAERDALLREWLDMFAGGLKASPLELLESRTLAAISASTEPSAPKT